MQVKSSCFQLRGVSRLMLRGLLCRLVRKHWVTRSGLQDTFFGELQVNHLEDAILPNIVYMHGVSGQEQYITQFRYTLEVLCHLAIHTHYFTFFLSTTWRNDVPNMKQIRDLLQFFRKLKHFVSKVGHSLNNCSKSLECWISFILGTSFPYRYSS